VPVFQGWEDFNQGSNVIPTTAVFNQTQALLAADATTLAPATDANVIALIIANFVPSKSLLPADLELATFTGSTPKAIGTGAQTVFTDPLTGNRVIQMKEPVGGLTFVCTADPTLPETVFGFGLFNDDLSVLLGTELLPNPVPISLSGDGVVIPKAWFEFLPNSPY